MTRAELCTGALLFLLAFAAAPIQADSATAQFAGAQLAFAEAALARAGEARQRGDYRLAGRLAAQAELDARLAWPMSSSMHTRRAAARVSRAAALLRTQAVVLAQRLASPALHVDAREQR
jgi:hypothetical protein